MLLHVYDLLCFSFFSGGHYPLPFSYLVTITLAGIECGTETIRQPSSVNKPIFIVVIAQIRKPPITFGLQIFFHLIIL